MPVGLGEAQTREHDYDAACCTMVRKAQNSSTSVFPNAHRHLQSSNHPVPGQKVSPSGHKPAPPLTAGAANNYRIRVTYMQGDREVPLERVISVLPGRTYELDLTRR